MKAILSGLIVLVSTFFVNAHFQISFPTPRGPFVEDDEPKFCDGFTDVTTNRTQFPLSGGFVTLVSEHPTWSAAFYLSTVENPNNFNNFSQVNSFFRVSGQGSFCIPLDLASSNVTGLRNGQNVTVQVLFDGGDGNLFQCADLTLTNSNNSVSSVECKNSTGSSSGGSTGSTGSALGTASSFDMKLLGLLGAASLILLVV